MNIDKKRHSKFFICILYNRICDLLLDKRRNHRWSSVEKKMQIIQIIKTSNVVDFTHAIKTTYKFRNHNHKIKYVNSTRLK